MQFILYMVLAGLLGLVLGVEVLVYKENEWVRNFMSNRPVLGCTAASVLAALALCLLSYLLTVALLAVLGLLVGGH
jgi:hypothetical protein